MLDILLTWLILHLGGQEVNAIAQAAIVFAGHWGLIALKMVSIALVIVICEYIGRRDAQRQTLARRLATFAIAVSAFPPTFAVMQLAVLAVNSR